jgi:hypothetical protein
MLKGSAYVPNPIDVPHAPNTPTHVKVDLVYFLGFEVASPATTEHPPTAIVAFGG